MRTIVATSVALLVASLATASTAGEIDSGLKVGDRVGAFNVKDVTGPNAGKSLCYR
jgi:hypothetical protein